MRVLVQSITVFCPDTVPTHPAENYMAEQKDFYKSLLDNLDVGIYFVDDKRRITFWNKGAERLSGYNKDEVVGRWCGDGLLNHTDDEGEVLCNENCPLKKTLIEGGSQKGEFFLKHAQGFRFPVEVTANPIKDDDGNIIGAVEIFTDISPKVTTRQKIEELQEKAYTDVLTGVTNRRYSDIKGKHCCKDLRQYEIPFGLIFIDIDNFKSINDTFGHLVGDEVLKIVAETLSRVVRTNDVVGRWGGDEFVVIVKNVDKIILKKIADKLVKLISTTEVITGGKKVPITISAGAAIGMQEDTLECLLRRADQAMYASKDQGGNRSTFD